MLRRLLEKCELRAREDYGKYDWRLEKYVETASSMLEEMSPKDVDDDVRKDYLMRVDFLKKIVESRKKENSTERAVAVQMLPRGVSTSDNLTKEIQQKTFSKYTKDIREELFSSPAEHGELRQRNVNTSTSDDLDALQKYHHSMHEKIAENMLQLTKNLKEQSALTNTIIKRDTEAMGASSTSTEKNLLRLKKETNILDEHNRKARKCWLWLIIATVIIIFLGMVMLMKVVRKR